MSFGKDRYILSEKIVIGMSGGVDSSVAAALLKERGYEVIGVTMRLWDGENLAVGDAKRAADSLGIELHELDLRSEFKRRVIDYFVSSYAEARTPNPCIVCNKYLKFGAMLDGARALGAELIATGHYVRIEQRSDGRYILRRAAADKKDQTYALYSLSQEQLGAARMPLGELSDKAEVRAIADRLRLPTASKPDSQEICFIPDNDYAGFIGRYTGLTPEPGNFIDLNGNILGRHRGIINYTIGQRKGLGVTFGKPMFVIKINARTNEVTLGGKGSEFSDMLTAEDVNFIPFDELREPIRALAKVRYSAVPALCTVSPAESGVSVRFDEPQRAVTPGQAVVFYDLDFDTVLGGGTIR